MIIRDDIQIRNNSLICQFSQGNTMKFLKVGIGFLGLVVTASLAHAGQSIAIGNNCPSLVGKYLCNDLVSLGAPRNLEIASTELGNGAKFYEWSFQDEDDGMSF